MALASVSSYSSYLYSVGKTLVSAQVMNRLKYKSFLESLTNIGYARVEAIDAGKDFE
jgi:hypothetical protein